MCVTMMGKRIMMWVCGGFPDGMRWGWGRAGDHGGSKGDGGRLRVPLATMRGGDGGEGVREADIGLHELAVIESSAAAPVVGAESGRAEPEIPGLQGGVGGLHHQ